MGRLTYFMEDVMKDYMSGDELYRYLHISKRKMKYLLENGYIPMIDTGMKTHRYRVKYEDARAFKRRMKTEPGCLSELTGMFNTSGPRKKTPPLLEPTEGNCRAFREYLVLAWAELPDALPTQNAAKLIGVQPQQIHKLVREGKLHGVMMKGRQFCAKEEIISYAASPEKIAKPTSNAYKNLIRAFKAEK